MNTPMQAHLVGAGSSLSEGQSAVESTSMSGLDNADRLGLADAGGQERDFNDASAPTAARGDQVVSQAATLARRNWSAKAGATDRAERRAVFLLKQQFEGTVLEIGDGEFRARLADRTNRANPAEVAVFDLEELSEDDLPLLQPGAVFYWSIGYREEPWGQRKRESSIKFRRLPAWSRSEMAKLNERAAELADLF